MGIRAQGNPIASFLDVWSNTGLDAVSAAPLPEGLTATGGIISDYTSGSDVYRAHIFTSTGTFDVTALGDFSNNVEYLVVGGGGGTGTRWHAGGGGGGGVLIDPQFPTSTVPASQNRSGVTFTASAGPTSYTITIGGGGSGAWGPGNANAPSGGGNSSISGPDVTTITANGGGYGGTYDAVGGNGGSGGGGGGPTPGTAIAGGTATNYPGPTQQGNPGGTGTSGDAGHGSGGGGGGAGAAGEDADPNSSNAAGAGGIGLQVFIAAPPTGNGIGAPGPGSTYQWFAGGGGGGYYPPSSNSGGQGGSWNGSSIVPGGPYAGGGPGSQTSGSSGFGINGTAGTGGGGGGPANPGTGHGGNGGSGIVAVRYQIGSLTATAKATGGAISFYGGKTIHTFTNSGTFATGPTWTSATVEYVVVGGGGGGGAYNDYDGGGGAGAYRTGTTPIGAHPVSTTIQVGGGGIENRILQNPLPALYQGTPSYFGTPITSPGGGGGAVDDGAYPYPSPAPGEQGMPGGSGGGNAIDNSSSGGPATGAPFPGTIGATPSAGWGHPGGGGSRSPIGGAGGGGAGAAGVGPAPRLGGVGIQLPATFRNPESTVGAPGPTSDPTPNGFDTSGKYWVAGGGDGGQDTSPPFMPTHGSAPGGGGGYWATPSNPVRPGELIGAVQNTGSGGGSANPTITGDPRAGGSGIVLIAYPT
jgi:hypothetical protein